MGRQVLSIGCAREDELQSRVPDCDRMEDGRPAEATGMFGKLAEFIWKATKR
jgi:hypothetical protein